MIRETGRKGELEQDKLFCLLLEVLEKMKQELAEDPVYRKKLDLERLQTITDSFRIHLQQGRELIDQLNGWMQRTNFGMDGISDGEKGSEYPLDTLYHMAVAEQEQDLHRMYPSKFSRE